MDQTTGEVAAPSEAEVLKSRVLELERELKKIATARVTRSDTQGKLALALSKAQGAMENASKDANNPFYGSKYADLASVWGAIRKPLSDNELAIFHTVLECNSKLVSVETRLHHSSDEWCATVVSLPITAISKDREKVVVVTAQHIGAALTYGRRYGIQLVTGNAPRDDDDGNLISGKTAGAENAVRTVAENSQVVDEGPPPTAPKTSAAAPTGPDFAADGTPVSEKAKLEQEIHEATELSQLKGMVERISKLPEAQKAEMRKLWGDRSKELKPKAPAAFAGERQSDRDAAAVMADIAKQVDAKTQPAEVTKLPKTEAERIADEPGSNG